MALDGAFLIFLIPVSIILLAAIGVAVSAPVRPVGDGFRGLGRGRLKWKQDRPRPDHL